MSRFETLRRLDEGRFPKEFIVVYATRPKPGTRFAAALTSALPRSEKVCFGCPDTTSKTTRIAS